MRFSIRLLMTVACACIAGCSSPEPRFYVLSSAPSQTRSGALASPAAAIGLGPIQLPGYLDRPQIVTRSSRNELQLAEFDRWAEPLKDNIDNVLAESIAQALDGRKVVLHPWKRSTPIAYQLVATIKRFDRTSGGECELAVRWTVMTGDGQTELAGRDSVYAEWPSDETTATTVAAMNRTLLRFSRDVASSIRELDKVK
jgi:uncharacterized lipoprotein YmbA